MTAALSLVACVDKPLAIDLFCGLGGWTEGLLAEGFRVVGFDVERHAYGEAKYPAQLVIQDVLTIHGSQFKDAALIVASPPCQEYSYMAMPWSRAKAIAADYRSGKRDVKQLTALFDACFRIQREASEAAGHHIPMVVENVRGAIPWVGRSRWNFGSFHLWGDVPALMPITRRASKTPKGNAVGAPLWKDRPINSLSHATLTDHAKEWYQHGHDDGQKVPGFRFDGSGKAFQTASVEGTKTPGRSLNKDAGAKFGTHNMGSADAIFAELGVKQPGLSGQRANGKGDAWFQDGAAKHGSKSNARKAASAMIAKIPLTLSTHIAKVYHP